MRSSGSTKRQHAHADPFYTKGLARLVAVADPTAENLAAEKTEIESQGVRWHLNYRDMLREETDLDAVVIATPIPFHYEMAKACIERGLFVHLEKPPVPLMKQLDELIAADVKGLVSESYDTASLRGRFPSGIEFSLAVTHITEDAMPFRIEVRGTEGWARLHDDGAILETSTGVSCNHSETTQQLINVDYLNFVDVLQGKKDRFSTRLSDTTGYVGTTNAMLLSSDGIHDIEPAFFRRYMRDNEEGYDVFGLRKAVEESIATGHLFSEQGCPWAIAKPKVVQLPLGSAANSLPFLCA